MKKRKKKNRKGSISGYMLTESQISAYVRESTVSISKTKRTNQGHGSKDKKTGNED